MNIIESRNLVVTWTGKKGTLQGTFTVFQPDFRCCKLLKVGQNTQQVCVGGWLGGGGGVGVERLFYVGP